MNDNKLDCVIDDSEIWIAIDGLKDFSVSNFGRIKSNITKNNANGKNFTNGYEIPQMLSYRGYLRVGLTNYETGVRKTISVHRLVANAFIPNPEFKPQVNHKDGNKENNHVENLEWCTAKENKHHAIVTGLQKYSYGDSRNDTKLPDSLVPKIYDMYFKEFKTALQISEQLCVICKQHVSQLIRGIRREALFKSYYNDNKEYLDKVIPILKKRNGVNQHIIMEKLKNATSN